MVAILVITGLLLIYLEFFLPSLIMAIGGALLLLASLLHFYIENPKILPLGAFASCLVLSLAVVIRLALWHVKKEQGRLLAKQKDIVGKSAWACSDLKPSGSIQVEGDTFPAIAQSGSISQGARVRIVGAQENCLLVSEDFTTP